MGDERDGGGVSTPPPAAAGASASAEQPREETIESSPGRGTRRRVAHPSTLTAAKRRRFLEVLAATANVKRSARAAGADSTSFYRLRSRDPAFAARWDAALGTAAVRLEGELLARALGEEREGADETWREGVHDDDGASTLDPKLALEVLKRLDAKTGRVSRSPDAVRRRQVSIAEVVAVIERRLTAIRGRGRA